ncbi:MAG: SulP family inorganic anion transporter [Chthoniobacter sp.]
MCPWKRSAHASASTPSPRGLPAPHWPQFDWSQLGNLVRPAFTIALLAAIESLLCAVVSDGMIEDKHDSNTSSAPSARPISGARSSAACPPPARSRAPPPASAAAPRTPVAGIVHSLTILLIVLVAAPLARFIPLPVLSAVLVVVAINMGEWHHFTRLRHWPTSDVIVYLLTFVLTIFTDITVAVEVGMILASMLFIRRIAETTKLTSVDERDLDYDPEHSLRGKTLPAGVAAFQLQGAFMFGAADRLESILARHEQRPRVIVLGMKRVLRPGCHRAARPRGISSRHRAPRQPPRHRGRAHPALHGTQQGRLRRPARGGEFLPGYGRRPGTRGDPGRLGHVVNWHGACPVPPVILKPCRCSWKWGAHAPHFSLRELHRDGLRMTGFGEHLRRAEVLRQISNGCHYRRAALLHEPPCSFSQNAQSFVHGCIFAGSRFLSPKPRPCFPFW